GRGIACRRYASAVGRLKVRHGSFRPLRFLRIGRTAFSPSIDGSRSTGKSTSVLSVENFATGKHRLGSAASEWDQRNLSDSIDHHVRFELASKRSSVLSHPPKCAVRWEQQKGGLPLSSI